MQGVLFLGLVKAEIAAFASFRDERGRASPETHLAAFPARVEAVPPDPSSRLGRRRLSAARLAPLQLATPPRSKGDIAAQTDSYQTAFRF